MAKLYVTINGGVQPLVLERATPNEPWSLPKGTEVDLVKTGPSGYSVLLNGRSFRVLVSKEDRERRVVRLRIGACSYLVGLEDERTHLVHELGLDKAATTLMRALKAPMPGLVLKMLVKEGDAVKKNDPVLILEAMKMENVIKSPGDGTVSKLHAAERTAVEKGQLLVTF